MVSLATFVASFGVDIWDPRNVGSHSTDEKSRDQWENSGGGGGGGMCMRGSGMCMNKNKLLQR